LAVAYISINTTTALHFKKEPTIMSQSATLYRISQYNFEQLERSHGNKHFEIGSSKSYATFQGSFMGLEFILAKKRDTSTIDLVNEIFNPKNVLGQQEFDSLLPEEKFEFYENGKLIPYLNTATIARLNDFLNKVSETDIHLNYDAKELNANGIYPGVWHNDNSENMAYNKRDILEGLIDLKAIVSQAEKEKDFILVFIG